MQHTEPEEAKGDNLECCQKPPPTQESLDLERENLVLKSQFESAIEMTSKIDGLFKENAKLKSDIRAISCEKDDLLRRLEISLKFSRDVEEKLSSEKSTFLSSKEIQETQFKSEILEKSKQYQNEINDLTNKSDEIAKIKSKMEADLALKSSQISGILESASHLFGQKIETVENLNELLLKPSVPAKSEQAPQEPSNERCLKRKIRSLSAHIEELEAAIAAKEKCVSEVKSQCEKDTKKLTSSLASEEERHRGESLQMQMEIARLKEENSRTASRIIVEHPRTEPKEAVVEAPIEKIITIEKSPNGIIEKLKVKAHEYSRQLKEKSTKLEIAEKKLCDTSKECQQTKILLQKKEAELSSLNLVHKEALLEIESLRDAIHSVPNESSVQSTSQIDDIKERNHTLLRVNDSQKRQIAELQVKARKNCEILAEKTKEIEELNAQISDLDAKNRNFRSSISDLLKEKKSQPEDVFAPGSWIAESFDPTLNSTIDKIFSSSSMSPSAKLRSSFSEIAKFYKSRIGSLEMKISKTISETKVITSSLQKFFIDLSIALTSKPVTYEQFLSNNQIGTCLVKSATAISSEKSAILFNINKAHSKFEEAFSNLTNIEGAEFTEQILRVKTSIDHLLSKLGQKRRKIQAISGDLKRNAKQSSLNSQKAASLIDQNESLSKQNAALIEENSVLKERLFVAEANIKSAEERASTYEKESTLQREDLTKQALDERNSIEERHKKEIKSASEQLNTAHEMITQSSVQTAKLQAAVKSQREMIKEKELLVDSLMKEFAQKEEAEIDKSRIEHENIVKEYEKAVLDIRKQNEALTKDLSKSATRLSKERKRLEMSEAELASIKREKSLLERDLKGVEEEREREKKVTESNFHASELSIESEFASKLNSMKTAFENERRGFYTQIVNEFLQYYNPLDPIDERSVRDLISKVRDELGQFRRADSSIRQIVCADASVRTEDAVAKAVIK